MSSNTSSSDLTDDMSTHKSSCPVEGGASDDANLFDAQSEFWDIMHKILPRFLRITIKNRSISLDTVVRMLQEDNPQVLMLQVQWLPSFVAVPGYFPVSSLVLTSVEETVGVHVFPMDIASGIPPAVLAAAQPRKVLDLCCCPGGKYLMLSEYLDQEATIVGVDISLRRLYTTKSLTHKYLNRVYSGNTDFSPPRMLLFCSDGTTFCCNDSEDLFYDSYIALNEIMHCGYKRKRNKSLRGREKKLLTSMGKEFAVSARSGNVTDNSSSEADVFDKYDCVLVDAQCTHDSSYRHLRYVGCVDAENSPDEKDNCADKNVEIKGFTKCKNIHSVESEQRVYDLQKQLIAKGFAALINGGVMVYSTCSAEIEQNENIVKWLIEQENGNVELLSLSETWCNDDSDRSIDEKIDADTRELLQLLRQDPIPFSSLSTYLLGKEKMGMKNWHVHLANEICRYYASFHSPPGRDGVLAGTAYFGMWGGTSGLFMCWLRKKLKKS